MLQKIGGWQKLFTTALTGICRGLMVNQDLNNNRYIVFGTNSNLEIYYNSVLSDITPVTSTVDLTNPLSTTSSSYSVNVHNVAHGQTTGNGLYIVTETSIGGILLMGFYTVTTVVDADHYTITSANAATSTVSNAGSTASFTTANTTPTVTVTLNNHGLSVGSVFTVNVSTTVGGLTILGSYTVASVTNANVFTITANTNASSTATASENGGNVRINYLLTPGPVDSGVVSGYGIGYYGVGYYGLGGTSNLFAPPREWTFGAWGEDMMCCPINGAIYIWIPGTGPLNNPAVVISQAPDFNTGIFIAMPQQQVVAFGAEVGGTQDPLLVRWCDVADYTAWTASITNQAGSFRIPRGSKIVGGIQGPQQGLIWTDLGLWAMQYIQPPFVYGFNELASGCGLIALRAMGTLNSKVYWMGLDNFYIYDGGSVQNIPCSVWDIVFKNLNSVQIEKITCAVNSGFNEVSWYFPSLSGDGEVDTYVKYNTSENVWDYGTLDRTAWIDQSIFGEPIGVDSTSFVQQHEVNSDADNLPLDSWAETSWIKLSDGLLYIFLERIIPDFITSTGTTMKITVSVADYPWDTPTQYGYYPWTTDTEYIIVRARGRLVKFHFESDDLGSFWRMGELLYFGNPAGRR